MFKSYSAFNSSTQPALSAVKKNPNIKINEFRELIAKSTPFRNVAAYKASFDKGVVVCGEKIQFDVVTAGFPCQGFSSDRLIKKTIDASMNRKLATTTTGEITSESSSTILSKAMKTEFNRLTVEILHSFLDEIKVSSYEHALDVYIGDSISGDAPEIYSAISDVTEDFHKVTRCYFDSNVDSVNMGIVISGLRYIFIENSMASHTNNSDVSQIINDAYSEYLRDTLFNAIYNIELEIVHKGVGTIETSEQFELALRKAVIELPTQHRHTRPKIDVGLNHAT